jgi:two-component system, chemotaxis family, protein-glutamate methylesterase/glutaminase
MHLSIDESLRRALASAMRAFDERVAWVRKLEEGAVAPGHKQLAESWARRRREYHHETDVRWSRSRNGSDDRSQMAKAV